MLAQLSSIHIGLAVGLLLICALIYYVVQLSRHELRIRKIGGVRAPSLTRNPLIAASWFLDTGKAIIRNELLEQYNSFFDAATPECPDLVELQIFPRERYLFTRSPEHIKAVLAAQFADYGKGPRFHDLWRPFLGDSIFTTDGQLWHDSRSLIRPMFIKDRVSDLATFEKGMAILLSKLPPQGQTVDIMDLFYRMTLDVTTDFLLGASVDSLSNPQSEFAKAFNDVQRIQMLVTAIGPFETLVPRRRYNEGIRVLDRFIMPYIEQALALPQEELEKLSNSDKHFTFLHNIARYTRNRQVLRDQIIAVLLAGRDTTAATLSWAFYELSRYPDKFKKLHDEIINSVGRTRTPTYQDLKDMPYLRHTLNETLRLYPAVPYNLRGALEDTTLPGQPGQPPISVVKGDIVFYSTLAMQRRKELYPPISEKFEDPAVFSPERWENWIPKSWQYVPFNGGARICVGQNFALTEMAYCMVKIVQKYDRLEYRGDWHAQKHETEVVGKPSQGVKVALYEEPSKVLEGPKPLYV
ncbi:cytochrome P450 monooxygenase CYP539B5 [Annulohypoxylon truncatum]|uniref:cytochrome P450 monooxygenase CYP539B5 n=1 Tax=Annulohypoxylon truncatum TaxID=327061 RepID=UPI002007D6A9|nr:cytochrome P450 monooxygenase CYP539B5 [Annulohypoxylon truncatum]KAI1211032.1 cytochrome P450 monooxygenase CYP539B5 [Annulohypoxylon truncatum]